jgi:ATP/maltotriose-dependent transcriptional regulator MalT
MRVHYDEQVEIARELGDRGLLARALLNASFVSVMTGDMATERETVEAARATAPPDDVALQAELHMNLGFNRLLSGDPDGAKDLIGRSVELHRQAGERLLLCEALGAMAGVAYVQGDIETATAWLRETVEVAVAMPDPLILSRVLLPEAIIANHLERFDLAATFLGAQGRIEDEYDVRFPEVGLAFFGDPATPARAALGDEGFERAYADGRALSQDEVVALLDDEG